jgi:hypothetical protein
MRWLLTFPFLRAGGSSPSRIVGLFVMAEHHVRRKPDHEFADEMGLGIYALGSLMGRSKSNQGRTSTLEQNPVYLTSIGSKVVAGLRLFGM